MGAVVVGGTGLLASSMASSQEEREVVQVKGKVTRVAIEFGSLSFTVGGKRFHSKPEEQVGHAVLLMGARTRGLEVTVGATGEIESKRSLLAVSIEVRE
jgi:hypothetical protein